MGCLDNDIFIRTSKNYSLIVFIEANVGFRYVIYSSGENTDAGKKLPITVLASFDFQGNGVVYDHYGNER